MSSCGVVVTGASGFIGSSVVRHLLKAEIPVTATARRSAARLTQELDTPVQILDVMGDIAAQAEVFNRCDTLVHCATPNDIQSRAADGGLPLAVDGTFRLVEEAVRRGISRLIILSTLQVYGTELHGHVDESTPVRCESPYALNHFLAEEVCRLAAERHGINVVALRPSNVYGVPSVSTVSRSTLVPTCFIRDAQATGSIKLRSSGRQMRNFISTVEVAETVKSLLSSFPDGFKVVNAVSAWHTRIIDIANMVEDAWIKQLGKRLNISSLTDEPATTNSFTVTSQTLNPFLTEDQSCKLMANVISQIIASNQPS